MRVPYAPCAGAWRRGATVIQTSPHCQRGAAMRDALDVSTARNRVAALPHLLFFAGTAP
jgi:hypothetical protein